MKSFWNECGYFEMVKVKKKGRYYKTQNIFYNLLLHKRLTRSVHILSKKRKYYLMTSHTHSHPFEKMPLEEITLNWEIAQELHESDRGSISSSLDAEKCTD